MDLISRLFDSMDAWRHLPKYQLERRADLFFSLYLPEVLEIKLGFPVNPDLVPEFPVRIGTINPYICSNASKNIDYVAISAASDKVVLVELKTDDRSRNDTQDNYLMAAQQVGFASLLEGVLEIYRATEQKRKYFCLLERLAQLRLLAVPREVCEFMRQENAHGIKEASKKISVTCGTPKCLIVYVQPNGDGAGVISYDDFRAVVAKHDDPVSKRFAQSLKEWANVKAGSKLTTGRPRG